MKLPDDLHAALELQLTGIPGSQILAAAEKISLRYRERDASGRYIRGKDEALAYAVTRMPATFGAVYKALGYSLERMGTAAAVSLLDVGAGTGAASWAASGLLDLDFVTCFESSDDMLKLGKALANHCGGPLKSAEWIRRNIASDTIDVRADYVIASYVLNELDAGQRLKTAEKLWNAAKSLLLLVEPGTPGGYLALKEIRQSLLEKGARIMAPCPHENPCPLPDNDWCNFSCRIERTRLHKLAKGGDAPYEDEKFIYLALSRERPGADSARVLRRPYIGKGYVRMKLCTQAGIIQKIFAKRDGELYKTARKADCGDIMIEAQGTVNSTSF